MSLSSPRSGFVLGFLLSALVMGVALYLEHVVGLTPCPLCIAQRLCIIGFGLVCLIAAIHGPGLKGRVAYLGGALLFIVLGGALAGRQVWLQGLPPESLPSCLPSLEYMLEALPFQEIVRVFLHGSADCAEVSWTLLTLSLPEWTLLLFIAMGLGSCWQLLRCIRALLKV